MPEIVEVSMPSSRTGPASKSSRHACCGVRALTFNSDLLSVRASLEDLFSGTVRRAVLQEALREPWVLAEEVVHGHPGHPQPRRDRQQESGDGRERPDQVAGATDV